MSGYETAGQPIFLNVFTDYLTTGMGGGVI